MGVIVVIATEKFKTHCLELMDRVNRTHEEITIAKRGKPVARLVPIVTSGDSGIIGYRANSIVITGDITIPVMEAWHADHVQK